MSSGADGGGGVGFSDNELFTRLYEEHRVALLQFCAARLGDVDMAQDVVQESFVKAFLRHDRYDETRPYWPWLASIAARECVRAHRRRAAATARVDRLSIEPRIASPDPTAATVLGQLDQANLLQTVDDLPERQGAALRLLALQGLSYAEAAAQLGASIAAVRTLVMRGRVRLRERVAGPLAAVFAGERFRRWRQRRMIVHAEASFAAWGSHLAMYMPAASRVSAVPTFIVAVTVSLSAVISATVSPVEKRHPVETPQVTAAAPAEPPVEAPVPAWSEPPLRREQAAVERSVNETRDGLLPTADDVSVETAMPQSVAVSPGYGENGDHTVFYSATGRSSEPVLFVSRDGGARWERLPARGFAGGRRLMLAPRYPRDPTIFALGVQGLQISRDDGQSFETLIFGGGVRGVGGATTFVDAALPPDFGPHHPVILLVGGGRVFEYRFDTGELQPLAVRTANAHHNVDLARYGPNYPADPSLFLSSTRMVETSSDLTQKYPDGEWLRCVRELKASTLPGDSPEPELRCDRATLSDSFSGRFLGYAGDGGVMLGFDSFDVHMSTDGGRSFARRTPWTRFASSMFVNDVAVLHRSGATTLYVAAVDWEEKGADLHRSDDLGQTWEPQPVKLPGFEDGAKTVHVTPTGRVIAAGMAKGLACSEDGGRTWAPTCPTADAA